MALTAKQFIEGIYVAYFGRAGDPAGVGYWLNLYNQGQFDFAGIAENFAQQEEATDAYAYFNVYFNYPGYEISDSMREAFVTEVYQNLFNRAPDADGLAYWLDVLESGASSPGAFIAQIINAAYEGREGASADDWNNLWAKIQVAEYYTDQVVETGADWSAAENLDDAQAAIAGITASSDLEAAFDAVDSLISGTVDVGQTFTLTENVETVTGNFADNTFNAYSKFTAVGQVPTLQSGDQVNGGEGTDKLIADLFGGTTVPTLNSVEKLLLSDYSGVGSTLNLSSSTGVQSVEYKLIVAGSTLDAVPNLIDLAATNVTGDRDITVNYLAAALSGSNDQKVTVDGADLDDLVINGPGAMETVTINVGAGESSIDGLSGTALDDGLTKVVITGEGKLTANLTNNTAGTLPNTNLETVDASAATGDLNLTVGVALNQTVKGGSGNDTLNFGATLTKDDTVDGGDGTDTIIATGNLNDASYAKVTNVENVTMVMNGGGKNTTNTLNAGAFTGLAKVTVELQPNLTTNSDDATVALLASGTEVVVQDMTDLTAGASDGTVDDITVVGANVSGSSDTLNFTLNARRSGTDLTVDDLIAQGYETINLKSTGAVPANANIENVITNGIADTSLKTLNISGDRELIIGGNTAATTVDASAMTAGGVSIGLGAADQKVTGSAFNDTFTIAYGNLTDKDTIDGGDGTDTLNLTNGGAAMSFAGSTNAAKLKNVTNFEKLGLSFAGDSIVLDDISMGAFTDNTVSVAVTADVNGTALDVSGVKNSNAVINFDTTKVTTAGNLVSFVLSNGKDVLEGGAVADLVFITDDVYISSGDSLKGGAGNNNDLVFTDQGTAGATNTFAASQFTGLSGFNTWRVDQYAGFGDNAETFDITIDNAVAAANAHSTTSVLKIDASDTAPTGNDDTLKLDASAVGAAVKLDVTGGDAADTIKTGAGDDTIDGGQGADTITVGEGKDTVVLALDAPDTITDFNFGAAAGKTDANIDKLDVRVFATAANFSGGDFDKVFTITADSTALGADNDIIILAHKAFDDAAAVDAYLEANNTGNIDDDVLVIYQDTLGRVRVAFGDGDGGGGESGGNDFTTTDVAILTNLTLAGVKDIIDTGDFIVV